MSADTEELLAFDEGEAGGNEAGGQPSELLDANMPEQDGTNPSTPVPTSPSAAAANRTSGLLTAPDDAAAPADTPPPANPESPTSTVDAPGAQAEDTNNKRSSNGSDSAQPTATQDGSAMEANSAVGSTPRQSVGGDPAVPQDHTTASGETAEQILTEEGVAAATAEQGDALAVATGNTAENGAVSAGVADVVNAPFTLAVTVGEASPDASVQLASPGGGSSPAVVGSDIASGRQSPKPLMVSLTDGQEFSEQLLQAAATTPAAAPTTPAATTPKAAITPADSIRPTTASAFPGSAFPGSEFPGSEFPGSTFPGSAFFGSAGVLASSPPAAFPSKTDNSQLAPLPPNHNTITLSNQDLIDSDDHHGPPSHQELMNNVLNYNFTSTCQHEPDAGRARSVDKTITYRCKSPNQTFRTCTGRTLNVDQMQCSVDRLHLRYGSLPSSPSAGAGNLTAKVQPLSLTMPLNLKSISRDDESAMVERLHTSKRRIEKPPPLKAVKIAFKNTGTGFVETLVPVKMASADERIAAMVELYNKCLESKKKTEDELASKYLQPLGRPRSGK